MRRSPSFRRGRMCCRMWAADFRNSRRNGVATFAICEENGREWVVHVISKKQLREFWEDPKHPHAESPLLEWFEAVEKAEWHRFADVKKTYSSCDQVGSKTVFDVGGNRYRIIAF